MKALGWVFAALLLVGAAGGCGDDDEDEGPARTSAPPTQTETTAGTTATTEDTNETVPATETGAASAPAGGCGRAGGLQLEITGLEPPCSEVRQVANRYDRDGEKLQEIQGWVCVSGTAETRPIVFTCTSGAGEFVAKSAG